MLCYLKLCCVVGTMRLCCVVLCYVNGVSSGGIIMFLKALIDQKKKITTCHAEYFLLDVH